MFEPYLKREPQIVILTVLRLALAGVLCMGVLADQDALALAFLVAVVMADIADGMIARKLGVDTNRRRAADCIIDRISIHLAFLTFSYSHPTLMYMYAPLAARDLYVALVSWSRLKGGVLLLGGKAHRIASISDAVWGACLIVGTQWAVELSAAVALFANYVLLIDYLAAPLPRPGGILVERVTIDRLSGLRRVCTGVLDRWSGGSSAVRLLVARTNEPVS